MMHLLLFQQALRKTLAPISLAAVTFIFLAAFVSPVHASGKSDIADLLELRGYTRIGGVLEFSIYNKEDKRSEWLQVNEEHLGYKIERYDPDTNSIFIRYRNQSGTLHLQASRIADYVEPDSRPETASQSAPPAQNRNQATTESTLTSTPSPAMRNLPDQPESRQQAGERSSQPVNFVSRSRSSRTPPETPGSPSPGSPSGETPPPGGNGSGSSYWERMSSPPPDPSTPPPSYSPEG